MSRFRPPSPPWRLLRAAAVCALALGACGRPAPVPTETELPTAPPAASATPAGPATATPLPEPALPIAATLAGLSPSDVAFDAAGSLYVSTCGGGNELVKIDSFWLLTVIAGTGFGGFSGDGGPALYAEIACAPAVALDHDGNVYVVDQSNHRIRRIDRQGIISTFAGSGPGNTNGIFAGDGGPAVAARLNIPTDIAFDVNGNSYIVDSANNRIRMVDHDGIITTIAGTGEPGFSGDGGPATAAKLNYVAPGYGPPGIAIDAAGNLYISDSGKARVRKVDRRGIITTIAGTGTPGFAGDGGPATAAQLNFPTGLAFGADGSLYIASGPTTLVYDSRIRKIDRNGIITTVAGTGEVAFSGDGEQAVSATLTYPDGLGFDGAGNLYIADGGSGRVRRVDTNGIIMTVVGGGYPPN